MFLKETYFMYTLHFSKDLNDLHKYLLHLTKSQFVPDMLILDDTLEIFIDNQFKVNSLDRSDILFNV